jgi:hypothetical protein
MEHELQDLEDEFQAIYDDEDVNPLNFDNHIIRVSQNSGGRRVAIRQFAAAVRDLRRSSQENN